MELVKGTPVNLSKSDDDVKANVPRNFMGKTFQ